MAFVNNEVFLTTGLGRPSRLRLLVVQGLEKLGIHHVLFVVCTLIAAFPVLTLASWVENRAIRQEIETASEQHLTVARNLAITLSRYVTGLKADFGLAISTFYSGEQGEGLKQLLSSLDIREISIVNGRTGEVERYMPGLAAAGSPPTMLTPEALAELRGLPKGGDIAITDLRRDAAGKPTFFLTKALPDGRFAYGAVGTRYMNQLQKEVAVEGGPTTIIDRKGAVIADANQDWVNSEYDLSKSLPAQAVIAGKTGTTTFYSPTSSADALAAYAAVPGSGWGIIVQKPVAELYARADDVRTAAIGISSFGLLAAAILAWLVARYIARPLQSIGRAAGVIAHGDMTVRAPSFSAVVPRELHELSGSFNHMVDELSRTHVALADTATRAEAANRAKSEFLANMSHELRTPLNAILGFSEIMRDEAFGPLSNPRYQGYVRDINSSAGHLISVISDILDLSKAEAGAVSVELGPVMLPELFEMTVRLVDQRARAGEVTIGVDIGSQLARSPIHTDEGKLRQILLNLLSNSIKFTRPGGRIHLAAEAVKDTVVITVGDNGIGIAPQDIATVLTPFGQVASAYTAREGFGLGLPLSQKLAERLGGSLSIKSQLGEGTTVSVRLPLFDAAEEPSDEGQYFGFN